MLEALRAMQDAEKC